MKTTIPFIVTLLISMSLIAQEKTSFPSLDKLEITADVYDIGDDKPVIILCHQAGYSRGEYREIAPKLNKLGFNCIAIDQRSGNSVNGVNNETAERAKAKMLPTKYINAEQDIKAAINFARTKFNSKVILWGSSYSASLVLKLANEEEHVLAVLSFSPGEYYGNNLNIKESAAGMSKPVFVTSSKSEASKAAGVMEKIPDSENKVHFIPQGEGIHGSRTLWESKPDHKEYWAAVTAFLEKLK
ncbi:MAG: alpha/beta hydrolase [Bacteroidetes bacterium]|nr:alpha/beta hydrolase [Bacteroidota bacterium]